MEVGLMNHPGTAFVVVDVQNDFVNGSLATARGEVVARGINTFLREAAPMHVVGTKDWHIQPGDHFAPEGEEPDFQHTWPVHCVAGTPGADIHEALEETLIPVWFHKGEYSAAYSGFEGRLAGQAEADQEGKTNGRGHRNGESLAAWLHAEEISKVVVMGIATDYCVKETVMDALEAGFEVEVLADLCSPVTEETGTAALDGMARAGAKVFDFQP